MSTTWLVHISDVHFGANISGGGFIPKLTSHDLRTLRALGTFLERFPRTHPGVKRMLVVSGDVTSTGGADELSLYRTLMTRGFSLDANLSIPPLSAGFDGVLDLPGNHDYWGGRILNPWLNPGARAHFQRPWCQTVQTERHHIVLHGLCSTYGSSHREQLFAVGSYHADDIAELNTSIANATSRAAADGKVPFHIVVTHHSPSDGDHNLRGVSLHGRAALGKICATHSVRALLTGHAHKRIIVGRTSSSSPAEVRCATTLQTGAKRCELLVHELHDTTTGLEWFVTPWGFADYRFVSGARTALDLSL